MTPLQQAIADVETAETGQAAADAAENDAQAKLIGATLAEAATKSAQNQATTTRATALQALITAAQNELSGIGSNPVAPVVGSNIG
jgi:hypothetical protein